MKSLNLKEKITEIIMPPFIDDDPQLDDNGDIIKYNPVRREVDEIMILIEEEIKKRKQEMKMKKCHMAAVCKECGAIIMVDAEGQRKIIEKQREMIDKIPYIIKLLFLR